MEVAVAATIRRPKSPHAEQTTVCSAFFIWPIMRTTNDLFLNHINVCVHDVDLS